jgi:hypothetical protein
MIYLGCLDSSLYAERKEFLECEHSPKLLLVLEKILKIRDIAKNFIKFEVGDGKMIHLWQDNWHPLGMLYERFGSRVIYDAHSRLDSRLDSVLSNGIWCWKPTRSEELVDIQSRLPEVQLGSVDKPIWTIARKGSYVSADTWDFLRDKKSEVHWWHVVWFPFAIPKHAFIIWLAVQNRLSTGDRLLAWGFQGDAQCVFCRNGVETRDHIFFMCSFSARIWKNCMQRCNDLAPSLDWQRVLNEGCRTWKKKTMAGVLCRLVLSSVVYNIWKARNAIKYQNAPKSEEQILKQIFWEVRSRIFGRGKFKKSRENVKFCHLWNVDVAILE